MKTARLQTVVQQLRHSTLRLSDEVLTDAQLLEDYVHRRDAAAFEVVVRRHGPMVLGVCRRILKNEADAQDAFQATFLVLVKKANTVRPRAHLCNWLYGVARNTALKARSMNRKRQMKERAAFDRHEPPGSKEHSTQLNDWLDDELARLEERYRGPIMLCDLEGKTIKEVARQLGWPQGTVATRLTRGRALLAKRLARRGLVIAGVTAGAGLGQGIASAVVPATLIADTVGAATEIAAGHAAASATSTKVATLLEGVLKNMLLTKIKCAAATFVSLAMVLGVGVMLFNQARGTPQDNRDDNSGKPARIGADDPPAEDARKAPERPQVLGSLPDNKAEKALEPAPGWKTRIVLPVEDGKVLCAAFSPDGKSLASLHPKKIILWDVASGKAIREFDQADALGLAFSPDGKILATSQGTPAKFTLWDVAKGKVLATRGLPKENFGAVAFSADGRALATAAGDGKVKLWSVTALLGEGKDVELRSINAEKIGAIRALAFSPEGKLLAAAGEKGIKLYDPAKAEEIAAIDGHEKEVLALAYSPLAILASAGKDATICLTELSSGKIVAKLEGHKGAVASVAVSPDGKTLASAGEEDKTVRLWDVASKKEIVALKDHTKRLATVAFSPDGKYLMTAGDDAIRIWERGEGPIIKGSNPPPPIDRPSVYERLAALPAELIKSKKSDSEIVDALFLASLKRFPTEKEAEHTSKHLKNAKDRDQACRDVLWSIANSLEFLQLYGLDGNPAAAIKELNEKFSKLLDKK